MVDETKRIAPRRDELVTSDNRMTQRFAEFLEAQTDTVNTLDEKSGVQDSLIALSNRQRGKITKLEQEVDDLKEMIFELSARKKPIEQESESDDERFALNRLHNKITQLTNRLDDIEAEAVHAPKPPKVDAATTLGPGLSTDNAAARFDGTTGVLLQDSGVLIDDSDNITGVVAITMSGDLTGLGGIDMTTTSTSQLILPSSNDAVSPTLAFGDGDSGFYETNDDDLTVGIAGTPISIWTTTAFNGGTTTANPSMLSEVASATNPVWSFVGDLTTGLGRAAASELALIAGGIQTATVTANNVELTKGIKFPATAIADSDANTFDDYEEGVFAVLMTAASGTITMDGTFDTMAYTKIGRTVHIQGFINISSVSTPTGALTVTGLPFLSSSSLTELADYSGFAIWAHGLSRSANVLQAQVATNATAIIITEFDGTNSVGATADVCQADTRFMFNFSYITDL